MLSSSFLVLTASVCMQAQGKRDTIKDTSKIVSNIRLLPLIV